ncbi:MAG: hypothetical protein ACFB51_11935, partial [Anaerolineae bacterium]
MPLDKLLAHLRTHLETDEELPTDALLHAALDAANMALWRWDMRTDELSLTPPDAIGLVRTIGHMPTTFTEWVEHIHPEDRALIVAMLAAYKGGPPDLPPVQLRLISEKGRHVWLELTMASGMGQVLAGVARDIPLLKHTDAQLEYAARNKR